MFPKALAVIMQQPLPPCLMMPRCATHSDLRPENLESWPACTDIFSIGDEGIQRVCIRGEVSEVASGARALPERADCQTLDLRVSGLVL